MAIIPILNQPVIFSDQRDDCANADTKEYKMLAQGDDRIHVQMRQTPCTDNLNCEFTTLGSELLTNGNFTGSAAGWNLTGTAAYGTNDIYIAPGAASIYQAVAISTGEIYKVVLSVTNYLSGKLFVRLSTAGAGVGVSLPHIAGITANGTHTVYIRFRSTADEVLLISDGSFWGNIASVSMKRAGTCYNFGGETSSFAGWLYNGEKISHGIGEIENLQVLPSPLVANAYYKITITVIDRTAGSITVNAGDDMINTISRNGTFSLYVNTGAAEALSISPTIDFDGSITAFESFEMNSDHSINIVTPDGVLYSAGGVDSATYDRSSPTDPIVYHDDYITWSFTPGNILFDIGNGSLVPGCYKLKVNIAACSRYNVLSIENNGGFIRLQLSGGLYPLIFPDGSTVYISVGQYTGNATVVSSLYFYSYYVLTDIRYDTALGADGGYVSVGTIANVQTELLQSNEINYAGAANTWSCSKMMSAKCEGSAFGFYFGDGFRLQQRLKLISFNPHYPTRGESYFYSDGEFKLLYSDSQKIKIAWFDYVDEATHDCIRLQLYCDELYVDTVAYFAPVKDYEPEWLSANGKFNLARARVEMQLRNSVLFNRNC